MSDADGLMQRFTAAQSDRENWTSTLRDAYKYALPGRERFYEQTAGTNKAAEIYDHTAVYGVQQFAARVQSLLMPPWREWSRLVAGPVIAQEQHDQLNKELEGVSDLLFQHFHHSNLDMAVNEALQDVAISTGALLFQEGNIAAGEPLFQFTSVPMSDVFPEEGPHNTLDGCWRTLEVPVRAIEAMWRDVQMSTDLESKKRDKPNQPVKLIEGTIPAEPGTWRYVLLEPESKSLLVDRTLESFPWILFRWSRTPGERLGRGPVMSMLSEIKVTNRTAEFLLRSGAQAVGGIYTARNDGVLNPYMVKLVPNTIIPVASNEASNPSLRPLEMGGLPDLALLQLEQRQEWIRRALLVEPFGPIDQPVKSATEMSLRASELTQQVGSQFGRLQNELIVPIINRGLYLMAKNGMVDGDVIADGRKITVQHQSPLARMQDQEDLAGILQFLELGQMVGPEALNVAADIGGLVDEIAEKLGVPAEHRRDEGEREIATQQMQEAAAQQQEAAA